MSQMAGLLERDRGRFGFTVGQAAYRLGLAAPSTERSPTIPAPRPILDRAPA